MPRQTEQERTAGDSRDGKNPDRAATARAATDAKPAPRGRDAAADLERFKTLADNIPDHVFFKDAEGRYLWANANLLKAHGLKDVASIVGKTVFDINPPERARGFDEDDQRVLRGESLVNKLEPGSYADGKPMWTLTTKIPLRGPDGSITGLCGIAKDVTTQIVAEQALAMESNLLDTLMQNVPDAIYFKDLQSRFLRVSKGIHLEGLKNVEEAVGKTDSDFFTPEHAQQALADEREIIRTGIPIIDKVEKETFAHRPDAWVSTSKVPVYDKAGKVTGLVGISRDVTERMHAEEAVRKAKDELEIRVQERTAELVQEIKEHQIKASQLQFLNSAAHRLAHYSHRRDLLPAILEVFTQSFPGLEACLNEMGENGYVTVAATPRLDRRELREACQKALNARGSAPLNGLEILSDWRQDANLGRIDQSLLENRPVYAALPLQVEDRCLAVLQLFAPETFLAWQQSERVVLNTLAAQAAVSLSNSNNFQELESRARVESELEVAQSIQKRFIPRHKPSIPGIDLKGVYHPAYQVGGDYLDYFQTDSGNWVIVIADVSGKGIPAALVMTMLRSTFRAEARYENSARKLLCAVNDLMTGDLDDRSFVTALCLILDKEGRSMTYARAGHPPLLFQSGREGDKPVSVNSPGTALGIVKGEHFASRLGEVALNLNPGDRFLIFTDGVMEAMNPDRKLFGTQRLMDILAEDRKRGPEATLQRILAEVRAFTHDHPYQDDLTMLAMEVTRQ